MIWGSAVGFVGFVASLKMFGLFGPPKVREPYAKAEVREDGGRREGWTSSGELSHRRREGCVTR